MTDKGEQVRKIEEQPRQTGVEQRDTRDQALESEAVVVEGRVSEIAKTSAGEEIQTSSGGDDDGQQKDDSGAKDDKAALKAKLLASAPKEKVMRHEVQVVLEKRKSQLESQVRKYKKKKNYHLLSVAIMRLRLVIRQLEDLAKAGYDKLKDIWLSVVHRVV